MLKGIYLLDEAAYNKIYGEEQRKQIGQLVRIEAPLQTSQTISTNLSVLQDVDIILSGWGCPKLTAEFLAHAPRLKAIFLRSGIDPLFCHGCLLGQADCGHNRL
jgi:phosphoglycerate dehydrogenase-like enzyme